MYPPDAGTARRTAREGEQARQKAQKKARKEGVVQEEGGGKRRALARPLVCQAFLQRSAKSLPGPLYRSGRRFLPALHSGGRTFRNVCVHGVFLSCARRSDPGRDLLLSQRLYLSRSRREAQVKTARAGGRVRADPQKVRGTLSCPSEREREHPARREKEGRVGSAHRTIRRRV